MTRALVALLVCVTGVAHANEDLFREATRRAAAGEPSAIDAFEAAGAARPVTRWTDDAWAEAARLAERARDFARARRDLEQAIAVATDPLFARRLRGDLARLASLTGGGDWNAVAAQHDRLISELARGDDPAAELSALEQLVRDHPSYPRAPAVRWAIARGWDEEGDAERARTVMREAVGTAPAAEQGSYRIAWTRMLIRHGELAEAGAELDRLADPGARRMLERELATAHMRAKIRWAVGGVLILLLGLVGFVLRRSAGSWRAAARRLVRPPIEVLYFLPIAIVVAIVAGTGNPLVGRAVVAIVGGGLAIAWLSGVTLERTCSRPRLVAHAVISAIAVLAMGYLVVDHLRLLDLIEETVRTGPGR